MINKLAESIAISIRKHDPNSSSLAVLKYSLIALINAVLVIGSMIIVGIITGDVVSVILASLAFPVLRYFSGGMHLQSSTLCNVVSVIIIMICVYSPIDYWYNGLVLNVISVVLLGLFAPSGIKQSKIKKEKYPLLKLVAVLIVCSNFIIHSPVLSIAFFIQAVTTIPLFEKWLDRLNL